MVTWTFLILLTAATLGAAAYAHLKVGPRSRNSGLRARLMLLVTGLAFGGVMAFYYTDATGFMQLLVFTSAFGLVHVPAAFILFLKTLKRRQTRDEEEPSD